MGDPVTISLGWKAVELMVIAVVSGGGFGLTVHTIKKNLESTETRIGESLKSTEKRIIKDLTGMQTEIDDLQDKHHDCREELPVRYAEKEDVSKLWEKHDDLSGGVSYLKGLQNGAAKGG